MYMKKIMITDKHLEKIRHACALKKPIKIYRNYFVAEYNSPDDKLWETLVENKLATLGIDDTINKNHIYFATDKGIREACLIYKE